MQPIKVPYLRDSVIDHAVTGLLVRYGQWRNQEIRTPINIDDIAEGYLGLILEMDDLAGRLGVPDVLGATWFDEGRVCIDRSLESNEGRFSFTVAHEIAHWELHRPVYMEARLALPLFARDGAAQPTPAVVCRSKEAKAPAEWQADQFAARLLMPAGVVRATVRKITGDRPPVWEGLAASRQARRLDPRVRALADTVIAEGAFTNVSNQAMSYRLFDLKLVEDADEARGRLF